MTTVNVTRWKVVVAFLTILLVAVADSAWDDYRIDRAEERISRNSAKATELARVDREHERLRSRLLRGLQAADVQACLRIEELKRLNRVDARRNFNMLNETLDLLELERTPAIERAARRNLAHDLRRNAPEKCERRAP